MVSRNERLVEVQQMFRSANERLQALAGETLPADRLIPFVCECADADCLERVDMSSTDYGDIHDDRDRYAVLHDHQIADGEQVVDQRALYDVVSKAALAI